MTPEQARCSHHYWLPTQPPLYEVLHPDYSRKPRFHAVCANCGLTYNEANGIEPLIRSTDNPSEKR